MGRLRVPFFVLALVAIGLVVLVELASPLLLGGREVVLAGVPAQAPVAEPPGRGIGYLALVDVVALFTIAVMGMGLLMPDRLHGRLQGVLTLVAGVVLVIVAVIMLIAAVALLITMVTLLLAAPFGTIAYLVSWGSFPRGDAAALLSLLMFLKVVFVVMLVLAHQRFLQNKGLVALMLTALLTNLVLSVLHGLVPRVLVSITDDIGAIVFAVVALIWGVVLAVGSLPAIVKAVRAS